MDDVYRSEDECLPFPIFYAQLDLLADGALRGGAQGAAAARGADGLRLLQALAASLAAPGAGESVRPHQRAAAKPVLRAARA